jgi:hypothetical protein
MSDLIKRLREQVDYIKSIVANHYVEPATQLYVDAADALEAANARIASLEAQKLTEPAQVGGAVFRPGIAWEGVIKAAQRNFRYRNDPATNDYPDRFTLEQIQAMDKIVAQGDREFVSLEDYKALACEVAAAENREPVAYMMKHRTGSDRGLSWKKDDNQFSADWLRVPLVAAPLPSNTDDLSLRALYEDACIAANKNAQDAERYRWLRQQHWDEADMFVIAGSKSQVRLGTDCPTLVRLDDAIDAALAKQQPQEG